VIKIITLKELNSSHYNNLFDIIQRAEPLANLSELEFKGILLDREGWIVLDDELIIGAITLSDYAPDLNIIIHIFIDPAYQGVWYNDDLSKLVFNYVFNVLSLPKCSGNSIIGVTEKGKVFLNALGFKKEAHLRKAVIVNGELRDFELYGMLKEECRFI